MDLHMKNCIKTNNRKSIEINTSLCILCMWHTHTMGNLSL